VNALIKGKLPWLARKNNAVALAWEPRSCPLKEGVVREKKKNVGREGRRKA